LPASNVPRSTRASRVRRSRAISRKGRASSGELPNRNRYGGKFLQMRGGGTGDSKKNHPQVRGSLAQARPNCRGRRWPG
jgi:hypothetical protein